MKLEIDQRDFFEWLPPLINFLKLNFDEHFLNNLGQLGFGGLPRDLL